MAYIGAPGNGTCGSCGSGDCHHHTCPLVTVDQLRDVIGTLHELNEFCSREMSAARTDREIWKAQARIYKEKLRIAELRGPEKEK